MNNKSIISIIIGIIVFSIGLSLHRTSRKTTSEQYILPCKHVLDSSCRSMEADEDNAGAIQAYRTSVEIKDVKPSTSEADPLYTEKTISGAEPCILSVGGITLDVPSGAVSSEKEVTVRILDYNELPELDFGIVNVTSGCGGYRCLPHGKFDKPLQLSIAYDSLLIPAGYSPHDIRTFFYDEDLSEWVCMSIDSIDQEHQLVITSTDHFTDFINGILTQPDLPDASGYASTGIRGIEYANPLEGMNIMEPPIANNNGSCSMNFPVVIPSGRNGMTPQISISYNSDVKDGIMGSGWSLSIPTVAVDTRWGVPPYSDNVETESYLVNGEAVVEDTSLNDNIIERRKPLYVKKGVSRNTSGTRKYAYLTEGRFDKIIRHGNSPKNYWWEITDREGVKYVYGDSDENASIPEFSLFEKYPNNNIAVWGLAETTDAHGNFIRYTYDIDSTGSYGDRQFRIVSIIYTGHGENDGPYKIYFEYVSNPVATLSAKYGFLTSDKKLLSKITVTYNDGNDNIFVKCYKFEYASDAMSRKVLKAIAEITDENKIDDAIDCNNNTQEQGFYVHCFEYYNEFLPTFGSFTSLDVPDDGVMEILGGEVGFGRNISRNTNYSITAGGSACVGYNDGNIFSKSNTLGANYHYSFGMNNQKLQLMDLNGDGIVDRVEKTATEGIKFYKGKKDGPGPEISFDQSMALPSITRLGKSASHTHSIGTELLLSFWRISGMVGYSYSRTKTINSDYFMDVNGDGFVDYVSDGNVFLNFPDQYGKPVFTDMSNASGPVQIGYDDCYSFGYGGSASVSAPTEETLSAKRDPVIMWRSPLDCFYDVKFLESWENTSKYLVQGITVVSPDGTVDTCFYKDGPQCFEFTSNHEAFDSIRIYKGGYILFHIHSNREHTVEDIMSNIIINAAPSTIPNYISGIDTTNTTDADGKRVLHFQYKDDAVVQDGKPFVAMQAGNVKLSASIGAGAKSDTLHYYIIHEQYDSNSETYNSFTIRHIRFDAGQGISDNIANMNIQVAQYDKLSFRLESNSNVEWSDITFTSSVKYVEGTAAENDTTTYRPSLGMSIYANQFCLSQPVTLAANNYSVLPDPLTTAYIVSNASTDATAYLTAKTANNIIAKKKIVENGQAIGGTLDFYLSGNQNVYFDYTVNEELDVSNATYFPATVLVSNSAKPAGFYAKQPDSLCIFGNLYRGWGQFSYKDDIFDNCLDTEESCCISPEELYIDTTSMSRDDMEDMAEDDNSDFAQIIDNSSSPDFDADQLENFVSNGVMGSLVNRKFEPMSADIGRGVWIDPYSSAYVSKNYMGCGYGTRTILQALEDNELAEQGDYMPDFGNPMGLGRRFPVVNKVGRSISHSFSASAFNALGYNRTKNKSFSLSDMMDMNGDGYPDIVTDHEIQYTLPNGDMSDKVFAFSADHDIDINNSEGVATGGSVSFKPISLIGKTTNPKSTEMNICTTAGLNNNISTNNVISSYIDVNSDGLPDLVYIDDDNNAFVEYNLGYQFSLPFQTSNLSAIARNISQSSPISFGINFNIDNYSLSGGVNANDNTSGDNLTMIDINSDGLVDIVSMNNSTMTIYLNNGTGFGNAQNISNIGINSLSESKTHNISGNVSGTFGFAVMYVKVVASAYADFAYSFSNEKLRLMDINGDGAVDILMVDELTGIKVRYGTPQKHNLLKKVTTPALGEYEMAYSMLYPDVNNPSHKWTMTALKIKDNDSNNNNGFNDGHDSIQYQFSYSGMKYHRIERESYGFAEVVTKTVDDWSSASAIVLRRQNESFHTENGLLHGLKYSEEVLDASDNVQTKTEYKWTLNDLNTGAVVANPDCGGELYPRLKSEKKTVFGTVSSNKLTSLKHYEYTTYGNISQYVNKYRHNDSVTAIMTYEPDRTRNILGKMTAMSVKSKDNQTVRKIIRRYNNYGDILQVENYLTEYTYVTTAYQYDMYGNLTGVFYPPNHQNQTAFYIYAYDEETNTYLSSVMDAFECTTKLLDYDYRFGKPTRVIAPNGAITQYTYYSDGKLASAKAPTDLVYSARFEYWTTLNRNSRIRWARVIHHDTINDGNTFVTQTICDGLGRTMQTARKSVVDGSTKFVVSGKNVYDAYGRITATYQPQATTQSANGFLYNFAFDNPTTYTYDCMDRPLSTTTPDNITVYKSYDVSLDGNNDTAMLVTTTCPLGRILESYTDARGLQTTTTVVRNAGDITTKFEYSSMGELLSSIDPEGYATTYAYDWLGRLVSRTHPDAGTTTFTYDGAGNLRTKTTQKLQNAGQSITYSYNCNRLMSIEYPHNPEMNVYYKYGTSGYGKGLVTRRQDGVCVQSYTYNEMGDVVGNIRTFAMPSGSLMTLATSWEYDTWGRTKSMTYPDGETITYTYDNAGKAKGMYSGNSAIVSNIKYDKYGNRTRIDYGNGAYNIYTYDAQTLQLSRLRSFDATNTAMQDIAYTYDDLYNITALANTAAGEPYSCTYAYDTLNRLIESTGSATVGSNTPTYDFAMSYSPSGRILNYTLSGNKLEDGQLTAMNLAQTYSYSNSSKPHAPSSIFPSAMVPLFHLLITNYRWDANGNLKGTFTHNNIPLRNLYFNEENRLAAKSDWPGLLPLNTTISSSLASYLYSADGERVWKFAGTATMTYSNGLLVNSDLEMDKTFYPTSQTTLDKRFFYKHYYVGGERICTSMGQFYMTAANTPPHVGFVNPNTTAGSFIAAFTQTVSHALDSVGYSGHIAIDPDFNCITTSPHFRTKTYYYHYNHQGSVALVTYQNGSLQQHLQYLPYGGIFVDHRTGSYSSTYTFSAKEKDSESGYTYFGARYYSDNMMMWLSVDPMSDKYPSMSPYMYCAGNPIKYFDPDGKEIWIINREGNKVQYTPNMSTEGFDNYTVETINALNKLRETKTMGVYINGFANTKVQQISIIENTGFSLAKPKVADTKPYSCPNQDVLYDPSIGLEDVVTGETLSPALSLGHELGHIISAIIDPLGFKSRYAQKRNDEWTDDEEYYNITNFEHKIAEEWGELKRGGHNCNDAEGNIRYRTVEMKNSTSNEKRFE